MDVEHASAVAATVQSWEVNSSRIWFSQIFVVFILCLSVTYIHFFSTAGCCFSYFICTIRADVFGLRLKTQKTRESGHDYIQMPPVNAASTFRNAWCCKVMPSHKFDLRTSVFPDGKSQKAVSPLSSTNTSQSLTCI